jgi:hypothetical protein
MRTRRSAHALTVMVIALRASSAAAQDWSRYDEAVSILGATDTSLVPDLARLERVRAALERSRAAFPELRHITSNGPGTSISVQVSGRLGGDTALKRAVAAARRASPNAGSIALLHTGIRALDSLNALFGAARVVVGDSNALGWLWVRVEFPRPTNTARFEPAYEALGFFTGWVIRHLWPQPYGGVSWSPGRDADILDFRWESECTDPCQRHERYRVRVPHDPARPPVMVARSNVLDAGYIGRSIPQG